jgi:hypothetical protein
MNTIGTLIRALIEATRARANRGMLLYAFVFVITFLVWAPTLFNGLVWDDYVSVLMAPERWHLWNIRDQFLPLDPDAAYLPPLSTITYYTDELLWGPNAYWGWHLTNISMHAASAVLVAMILRPFGPLAQIAGGFAFGLHPVHTETVGWISARTDLQATLLILLSSWLFSRGGWKLSAVTFGAALISKEMVIVFPLILVGWQLLQRQSVKRTTWHWMALVAYLAYRVVALHGLGGREDWSPDFVSWLFQPWLALAFPLPFNLPHWTQPGTLPVWVWRLALIACGAIALLVIRNFRHLWYLPICLVFTMLPLLPLFHLGPSFQMGRYLYWPAACWALMVGIVFSKISTVKVTHRVLAVTAVSMYALTLIVASVPPRSQFCQVGTTGAGILQDVSDALPNLTYGAKVRVENLPVWIHGWGVFGGYLELAVNKHNGYEYDLNRPAIEVTDIAWETETKGKVPPAKGDELVLFWKRKGFEATEFPFRCSGLQGTFAAAGPEPIDEIDFGLVDLSLYKADGFRWNETSEDGVTTWNWIVHKGAHLSAPLDTSGNRKLSLRLMSAIDNTLRIYVNDMQIGEIMVPGGFHWIDSTVTVPHSAWDQSYFQQIRFEAACEDQGLSVAFDKLRVSPN